MGLNDIISKIFGNKAQRDLKEVNPYVKRVQEAYSDIAKLSNDELRNRTNEIVKRIKDYVADEQAEIERLKAGMEEIDLDQR